MFMGVESLLLYNVCEVFALLKVDAVDVDSDVNKSWWQRVLKIRIVRVLGADRRRNSMIRL